MAVQELAILDGRYQLIRQLGGPPRAPLMVASDLKDGRVVCVRLQRFTAAMASMAAVPPLAARPDGVADGPLLPYDFGVDEGTAYLVRDFVTAVSLEQRLVDPQPPTALEIVTALRRGGEALLEARAQGFQHPGLALRHILLGADGTVHVSGYDDIHRERPRTTGNGEGEMLAALVRQGLTGRPAEQLPAAVRSLLARVQAWQAAGVPRLDVMVRQLRRTEDKLLGRSRVRTAIAVVARFAATLLRRLHRLGPLLHPYLIVLALCVAIAVLAVRALSATAGPNRLYVYPVPTRAPAVPEEFSPDVVAQPHVAVTPAATAASSRAIGAAASDEATRRSSEIVPAVTAINRTGDAGSPVLAGGDRAAPEERIARGENTGGETRPVRPEAAVAPGYQAAPKQQATARAADVRAAQPALPETARRTATTLGSTDRAASSARRTSVATTTARAAAVPTRALSTVSVRTTSSASRSATITFRAATASERAHTTATRTVAAVR